MRIGETAIIGGASVWSDTRRHWFEKVQVVGWYCNGQLVELKFTESNSTWTDIRESSDVTVYAVL